MLEKAEVYYVIPKFENVSIAENTEWCSYILGFGKDLAMHGVYHEFNEFGRERNVEYMGEGVDIFEGCFGFKPERFKPPRLAWTSENNWMEDDLDVDLFWNQLFHKVYHCGDRGVFPNWAVRIF